MSDHNNGHRGPVVPFPQQNVPIIGQPCTVKSFFMTVQIVCNCDTKEPLMLVGPGIATCPACRRRFQLQGFGPHPNGQGLSFQIGLVADPGAESPLPPGA